jgi:hypothetical protein
MPTGSRRTAPAVPRSGNRWACPYAPIARGRISLAVRCERAGSLAKVCQRSKCKFMSSSAKGVFGIEADVDIAPGLDPRGAIELGLACGTLAGDALIAGSRANTGRARPSAAYAESRRPRRPPSPDTHISRDRSAATSRSSLGRLSTGALPRLANIAARLKATLSDVVTRRSVLEAVEERRAMPPH